MSGNRRGSIMVMALWLLSALVILAVALGGYLSTETRLMRYHLAQAQARAWARAGVSLGMQRLAYDYLDPTSNEGLDWLGDDWATPVILPVETPSGTHGEIVLQITDEERRLDLRGNPDALDRLLVNVPGVARGVIDYLDQDQVIGTSTDEEDQLSLQPPYYAKNFPIVRLDELWSVPAVQDQKPQSFERLAKQTTVFSKDKPNANTISQEALQAIWQPLIPSQIPNGLLENFINSRGPGADGKVGEGNDDCLWSTDPQALAMLEICLQTPGTALVTIFNELGYVSKTFRISVEARIPDRNLRGRVQAVVRRDGVEEPIVKVLDVPFQVVAWREG